jgi:hypothetical protein
MKLIGHFVFAARALGINITIKKLMNQTISTGIRPIKK